MDWQFVAYFYIEMQEPDNPRLEINDVIVGYRRYLLLIPLLGGLVMGWAVFNNGFRFVHYGDPNLNFYLKLFSVCSIACALTLCAVGSALLMAGRLSGNYLLFPGITIMTVYFLIGFPIMLSSPRFAINVGDEFITISVLVLGSTAISFFLSALILIRTYRFNNKNKKVFASVIFTGVWTILFVCVILARIIFLGWRYLD